MLPDHISASQINSYLRCSLAYRFKYLDGIVTEQKATALVLGSAFHLAAEKLHRDLMNGGIKPPQRYRDVLGDALATEYGCFDILGKDGEDRDTLTEEGGRLLDLYIKHRAGQKTKIVAAEQRVERQLVNVGTGEILDVPFVAFLDLIEEDADGQTIIDLKTTKKSYSQKDADGSPQMTCYGLLTFLETSDVPRLGLEVLVRNKSPRLQQLETSRTEDDFVRFWNLARAVREAIVAGVHYPSPGWQCSGCEYAEQCRLWGSESKGEEP